LTKEKIVQEIIRTARENGGQPLGQERFPVETGIRRGDWYGKYWARWSDALRDAGFAPNKFQESHPEDFVIEKYIELTRKLGHLPVKGELLLERKEDPSFPTHNSFSRWGTKADLISKIVGYCAKQSGFEDIVELCQSAVPSSDHAAERMESQGSSVDSDGYVYLIKSGRHYKIGRSNSVGRREYELAIQLPEKLKPIHSIRTDDPAGIEAYWHNRFAAKRANGEWFKLDGVDVQAFKRRRFM
jgi:hypothetical protein